MFLVKVKSATTRVAEAAAERNDVRRFLNEMCAADPSGRMQSSDLFDAYSEVAA